MVGSHSGSERCLKRSVPTSVAHPYSAVVMDREKKRKATDGAPSEEGQRSAKKLKLPVSNRIRHSQSDEGHGSLYSRSPEIHLCRTGVVVLPALEG